MVGWWDGGMMGWWDGEMVGWWDGGMADKNSTVASTGYRDNHTR